MFQPEHAASPAISTAMLVCRNTLAAFMEISNGKHRATTVELEATRSRMRFKTGAPFTHAPRDMGSEGSISLARGRARKVTSMTMHGCRRETNRRGPDSNVGMRQC